MRRNLGLRDRGRHRPGRVEIDAGDLGGQRRRRLFGLADDDAIAPHHLVVLDRFRERRGDVDDDVTLAEREIHVGEALQRRLELLDPLLNGNVERGQRPWRHGPGQSKPMAGLEALDGLGDHFVIGARRLVGGEVAGDDQPLAQQIVIGPLGAQCEFGVGRDRRPSATHGKIGIAERGLADALGAAFVKRRFMRECEGGCRARLWRRDCCCGLGRWAAPLPPQGEALRRRWERPRSGQPSGRSFRQKPAQPRASRPWQRGSFFACWTFLERAMRGC